MPRVRASTKMSSGRRSPLRTNSATAVATCLASLPLAVTLTTSRGWRSVSRAHAAPDTDAANAVRATSQRRRATVADGSSGIGGRDMR